MIVCFSRFSYVCRVDERFTTSSQGGATMRHAFQVYANKSVIVEKKKEKYTNEKFVVQCECLGSEKILRPHLVL